MTNLSHWNDIETHLSNADNQTKGELFEQLTEHFLRWSPKYQVILKHVWRLKDVPTNIREKLKIPNQDQGIDLVAESYEGKYWAIQCKYHGNYNKKISHREISTFLALSNAVASNIDFCLVATTADDYAQLYKGQNNIGFILSDTWTQLPTSFFDQFQKKEIVKTVTRNPRPHQKDAIIEAKKHFKVETRGKLIFPCGAGKSLTGYWITKELKAKTVIVAVPSLALVKQTLEDYCQESFAEGNPIAPFCICSDEGIGKNDDVAVFTQDLGVVCTTDKVKILDFLNFKTKRTKVLFTTYQSGRVLGDAVNEVNFKFDVGIMDESHKTVGATDKLFSHLLFDENVAIKKRIFMTATERRYKGSSENILSMDDPSVYGNTFTQLSFKEAIHQEILSDYKILTLVITQAEIKEYLNKNDFVKALGLGWEKDIDFRTLSSLVALRKAMLKFPIKHAVTFHSSIKRAKVFEQLQPIFDQAFPAFESVDAFHVTGAIPTSQRSKIIAEFSQSDRGIITNAKCLTEGVDVPNIDCVLFADPRKSSIDIVQAVGRALRRSKGKDFGYVLLPVFAESNDKESIIESEDFQAILQTLRALASNDERIIEYFREKQKNEKKSEKSDLVQFEIDEIIGNDIATDEMLNYIELQAWNRLAKLSWRPFEEATKFIQGLGIQSIQEYFTHTKLGRIPNDIPRRPDSAYNGLGWLDWSHFFGKTNSNFTKNKNYIDFEEAKRFLGDKALSSSKEYLEFIKRENIEKLPLYPSQTYKSLWKGWSYFLGKKEIKSWNLTEIKNWIWQNKIKGKDQFVKISKKGLVPKEIPKSFYIKYQTQIQEDFFYHEHQLTFEEARKWMHENKVSNSTTWRKLCREKLKPINIPSDLINAYSKAKEWAGFESIFYKEDKFLSKEEFIRFIELHGIKTIKEYNEVAKKYDYLPYDIYRVYSVNSWVELSGVKSKFHQKKFPPLDEAKIICKINMLKSQLVYWQFCRDFGLPYHPERTYKNKGWKGWADFLGKEDKE